jgi:hypothetical protein
MELSKTENRSAFAEAIKRRDGALRDMLGMGPDAKDEQRHELLHASEPRGAIAAQPIANSQRLLATMKGEVDVAISGATPVAGPTRTRPGRPDTTRDTAGHTTAGGYASFANASDGTTCTCGMNTAPVRAACQVSPSVVILRRAWLLVQVAR